MKLRASLLVMSLLALSACSEPWLAEGQVLSRAPAGTPIPPVNHLPGVTGDKYTQARMDDGRIVVYERTGTCTTPNAAYAMHHMAGKYECGILYTGQAHAGTGEIVFRDWLGRAYTPDSYGRWVRNNEYDLARVPASKPGDVAMHHNHPVPAPVMHDARYGYTSYK